MIENLYDFLKNELNHRLEKLWRIFSWTSTILIGITGGMAAIDLKANCDLALQLWDRIALSIVVLAIVGYARNWINLNLALENSIRKEIANQIPSTLLKCLNLQE